MISDLWQNEASYNFLSGPLPDITLLAIFGAGFRHFNCHVNTPHFCWRFGHVVAGTSFRACKKHHPSKYRQPHGKVTAEHIREANEEVHR
jgi:hypothetical protein